MGRQLVIQPLPGYDPAVGRALWALQDARRRLKEALAGLPEAAVDWIPPEGGNSIGALLYHVAGVEMDWLYADVLGVEFPPEVEALFPVDLLDEAGVLAAVRGTTLAEHLDRLDRTRALLLQGFRGMAVAEFRRIRRPFEHDVTPEWVLHHLCQHETEHRGQIMGLRTRFESENKDGR